MSIICGNDFRNLIHIIENSITLSCSIVLIVTTKEVLDF